MSPTEKSHRIPMRKVGYFRSSWMSEDSDSEENNINNVESQPRPSEEKNALSKSAINQLVKSVVAESKKSSNSESTPRITNEARDALATYGAIFIRQITDKALTHSMKKTMTSGNVFSALKDSGFADLAQECRGIAEKSKTAREDNRKRKKSKKLESLGISEEELLRQQEALFEKVHIIYLIKKD